LLSPDPDGDLEKLRAACLAMPETGERTSHGAPAFDVAGKMFAYFRHNHHGDGMTVVCVKTTGREEQEMLLEAAPDLYSRPAYLWPSGWIALNLGPRDTDWAHVAARLAGSYRLAAPRRLAQGG
jgi:phosphoribosylglycinamide formyltransferase-1/phosphoribosylamine--glycine ligase/phosphoribosylglycinamide formyltransferase/phosphoribosylformylglycinamidine cyclo-ligase